MFPGNIAAKHGFSESVDLFQLSEYELDVSNMPNV
jgi:hypothetical protein